MRTDVKIGVALGAVVLIVAVSYFGSKKEANIALREVDQDLQAQNAQVIDDMFADAPSTEAYLEAPEQQTIPAAPPADVQQGGPSLDAWAPEYPGDTPEDPEFGEPAEVVTVDLDALPPSELQENAGDVLLPGPAAPETALTEPAVTRSTGANHMRSPKPVQARPTQGAVLKTHVIERGDTFSSLAEKYYGSSRYARFLADNNPQAEPYHLHIGAAIHIPPLEREDAGVSSAENTPLNANQYRVIPNDTLYRIAERLLGSSARWKEIYRLNRQVIGPDPAKLQVGQILRIPARTTKPG